MLQHTRFSGPVDLLRRPVSPSDHLPLDLIPLDVGVKIDVEDDQGVQSPQKKGRGIRSPAKRHIARNLFIKICVGFFFVLFIAGIIACFVVNKYGLMLFGKGVRQ